ncbi:MAG: TonB-dependent receptor [Prevotellaceae bacterium]|jgi:hypothetical protein|nr:TonB-dependent receptor [Prevotellaceae bacterium]
MKRALLLPLIILLFHTQPCHAQAIIGLKINHDYRGQLDQILERMGQEMKIRFIFDKATMAKYPTAITTYEEKTIGGMLKMFQNSWNMVSLISGNGYIYIAKDKQQLAELQNSNLQKNIEVTESKKVERSSLNPIKRNFTLTGEVVDVESGERIPYATLHIQGKTNFTTTDANGRFTLQRVPTDTASITVSYIGYEKQTIELQPAADNKPMQVELSPQKQEIAEVFIRGRKDDKALEQSVVEQKIKMSPVALKFLPNIGEKDIMRSFQLMPGVSASNENSSGMYVRGGTPDQNLIVYDGFTVYYVDHLHGFYSAFNSNAIKDVQLYKGGFESKFGGRLSSVTEITGKDGNSKKITFGGDISLLSVNAYAEIPIGDEFTSLFAFRRSYQGWLYKRISNETGSSSGETVSRPSEPGGRGMQSEDPDSYFYDMNAKITWNATKKDIFSVSFFNGADYLDNTPTFSFPGGGGRPGGFGESSGMSSFSMDNSDYTRYGNVGISARWSRKLNDKLTSTLLASYSNFYSTRDESRTITYTDSSGNTQTIKSGVLEDNDLRDYTVSNAWKYSLNDRHTLEFGAFGTYYDINYSYGENDTAKLVNKADEATLFGVHLQDKIRLFSNKLTVTPGLRTTYFSNTHKIYFEPRLSASYAFTPQVILNAATGVYNQFANRVVREDVMSGNTDFWILSDDKNIPVSSSTHFNLGVSYNLTEYLFSVDAYYKSNANISEYTMRFNRKPLNSSSLQTTEQFYTGDGYATGIELLAQKKAGQLSGWVSYTIGEVKNKFPLQSSQYFFAYQDVTHEFKTVGIYKFGNFDFSATWIYSTGRPYTAPLGGYTLTLVDGAEESYFAVSDKNTFRLPAYHRLDLAASFRFDMFGTKGKANAISVSLFNAYNRHNVSAKKFQIVDGAILESNINYLGITPNISLSFKF